MSSRHPRLRLRAVLVLVAALLFGGSAFAQNWFGLRTGYPLGGTAHYGIENAFDPGRDARISANLRIRNNDVDFGVGFDYLQAVSVQPPFTLYVGGGPAVDFGRGGILIEIHGLAGGEFRFTDVNLDPLGIFAEISVGAGFGIGRSSEFPRIGGAVGFNYHF